MLEWVKAISISHFEARRDPVYGWAILIVVDSREVADCQARTHAIASELRALYDLKE